MILKSIKLLAIAAVMCFPLIGKAWGVLGHRIVGQIADDHLTHKAKKEIKKILGNESIAIAANWPDFIKSNPSYKYLSPWHYVNFEEGLSQRELYNFLSGDTAKDAYTAINFLSQQLRNKNLNDTLKVQYLKLLIHIVGDIHQPMHTGRLEDLGGNKIKVLWFNDEVNLHQIWDERLIDFQQLSYTEYAKAINFSTKEFRKELQNSPVSQWLYESYGVAEKIYADIKPGSKLKYEYNYNWIDTLNIQLLKGGIRLAGLLNEIFG